MSIRYIFENILNIYDHDNVNIMYLFTLLYTYMFLLVGSMKTKTKFCVNCRHFIPNESNNEYGKCSLFVYENSKYLVDGVIRDNDYYACSTARSWNSLCGKAGKNYKKKYTRRLVINNSTSISDNKNKQ